MLGSLSVNEKLNMILTGGLLYSPPVKIKIS